MNAPTVIVTACSPLDGRGGASAWLDRSLALAEELRDCGLPILLLTDQATSTDGSHDLASPMLHSLQLASRHPLDRHVEALIEGVLLSARAPGWIWVPSDTPILSPKSVLAVAMALSACQLVHAEHAQQGGIPLGIGAEYYSELMQLSGHRDMLRFRTRYPAVAIAVPDPGVIMSECGHAGMSPAPLLQLASPTTRPH